MNTLKKWLLGLMAFLLLTSPLKGLEVVVNVKDENFSMEVDSENSFESIVDTIKQNIKVSFGEPIQFNIRTSSKGFYLPGTVTKQSARNYYQAITAANKADIATIVRAMANNSLISLAADREALNVVGARIENIHPLKFLHTIFTDEELKVCMRNLQGRSWVWREFIDGLVDSLRREAAAGNMKQVYLNELASQVKVAASLLNPSFQNGRWEEFVNILIDKVPRSGNSDRYRY